MKKYILLTVFALVLGLYAFSLNAGSLSAANCAPGDLFHTMTGMPCSTAVEGNTEFKIGSRGEAVRVFQQLLLSAGFSPGRIDGIYGRLTESAAMKYRAKYSIQTTSTNQTSGQENNNTYHGTLLIEPASVEMRVTETVLLEALLDNCPPGAMCLVGPMPVEAVWKSSNTRVATVAYKNSYCPPNLEKPCLAPDHKIVEVTGVGPGTAVITASFKDPNNTRGSSITAKAKIPVRPIR